MELESSQQTRTSYNGLLLIALVNLLLHVHGGQHNAPLTWIVTNHVKRSSPQNLDIILNKRTLKFTQLGFFYDYSSKLGCTARFEVFLAEKNNIYIFLFLWYTISSWTPSVCLCILPIDASGRARMVNILIPV
jgi:hypothetical protein